MSQPPFPPADAGREPPWSGPPAPSWAPPWEPPAAPVPPVTAAAPARAGDRLVLALVAAGAALAGALGAGILVTVVLLTGGKAIGKEIAATLGPAVEDGVQDGAAPSMEGATALGGEGTAVYGPEEPVQQFPAVEPGELGPDPVLNTYAGSCFAGELQACDDLYYEAPPLSDYEEYGSTCGGRVKAYSVMSCTELE
jgi:hypothetical protein